MSNTHKVTTDALDTLGTIITEGHRDAIHLAVEPCIAAEVLHSGQHIGIVDGKATTKTDKLLGIVDPFLKTFVPEGGKFWLIVYPRTITSLRHVWSHPDFADVEKEEVSTNDLKESSEQWLRDWCKNTDDAPSYEDLLALIAGVGVVSDAEGYGGKRWRNEGDYLLSRGSDAGGEIPNAYEVKHHIEIVTGKRILSMPAYFSCSC
jgi:hypothetical protein